LVKRPTSAADNSDGFTLIESLVALAILGVIVGVLVRVHLQTLRADHFSRLRAGAVLECETILTELLLGQSPQTIVDEAGKAGWIVKAEPAGEDGKSSFMAWRVAVSNPSAPVVVMELKPLVSPPKEGKENAKGTLPDTQRGKEN
jgi:prepilin-type N-terminal cleavage/methylation domain-containing protein